MKPIAPASKRGSVGPGGRLVVTAGPDTGMRVSVDEEATIGRADAKVLLDDEEVSRCHALVRRTADGGYEIVDLDSSNGTLVNGQRIEQQRLSFGDEIAVGQAKLVLERLDPLEDELLQRRRLEALGRIGAGIAHDFNNALGVMLGNLEFLQENLAERRELDEDSQECVHEMTGAIEQAASLVSRLLHAVSDKARRDARCNVTTVCEQVLKIIRRTFERSVRIEEELEPGLVALGDGVELHQVIMNLCLNARDAMPRGGELTVRARLSASGELPDDPLFAERPAVVVTVEDTGAGMDAETQARIFEPFFTTKRQAKGFGLGLATSRDFVVASGGRLDVQSVAERGSVFRVLLPAAALAPPTVRRRTAVRVSPFPFPRSGPRAGTVLVADDEATLRRILERTLRGAGYDVVLARDGAEAVRMYAESAQRPDVVVMDLDMPNVSGLEAQRQLCELDANARVVILTGHGSEDQERQARLQGALAVLHKPAKARLLLDTLAEAMQGQSVTSPGVDDTQEQEVIS